MKSPSPKSAEHPSLSGKLLFLALIIIELSLTVYLIAHHRIPAGHDGFQYFLLQYYFLNNAVVAGEIPQWMPFMTQGTIASWCYPLQAGIPQNVFFLFAPLLKKVNFFDLFHIGIFIDGMILLTGAWLLAKRFFTGHLTHFFVTATILGSCIWTTQPWWNFHIYYALPLILYLGHCFLEKADWKYFFLAVNLTVLQALGQPLYCLPMTSLIIFLYFLFYGLFNVEEIKHTVRTLKFNLPAVCFISASIISVGALYLLLRSGSNEIANYSPERQADGTNSLETFLTYATNTSPIKWLELILGISPSIDYTLYIGMIAIPLILIGLPSLAKKTYHIPLLIIVLLFISTGTFVAAVFYYIWPMMKFFRHLALISPVIKIFLCFLAGLGLEKILSSSGIEASKKIYLPAAGITFIIFLFLYNITYVLDFAAAAKIVASMLDPTWDLDSSPKFITIISGQQLTGLLAFSACLALASFGAIVFCPLIKNKEHKFILITVIVLIQAIDLYHYKSFWLKFRSVELSSGRIPSLGFSNIPYSLRRDDTVEDVSSPRFEIANSMTFGKKDWFTYSFLFKDKISNYFRTDYWMKPLDKYMKAYWGQPIGATGPPEGFEPYEELIFPLKHPAAKKISGLNEDKIQFFNNAYLISDEEVLARTITGPEYLGNSIFLSAGENSIPGAQRWIDGASLKVNDRLQIPYKITQFNSNNLVVALNNTSSRSIWMFYSDVWHSAWKAKVNEKETPIYKANLAYKSVQVPPGESSVHFYFKLPLVSLLQTLFSFNSLLWVLGVLYLIKKMIL